jgi:hypothetical protein
MNGYIIYSNNSKEIIPRAKFSSRKMARTNLLKEAQNWLLNYKTPQGDWEIISKKSEIKSRTAKFYIKRSDKNEDCLKIYQQVEIVRSGWIYNAVEKVGEKIISFSIMEISIDSEAVEPSSYIVPMSVRDADPKLQGAIDSKRNMIDDLKNVLSARIKSD